MKVGGYRPSNSWLRRQLDTSWYWWVILCFAGAGAVSVVMAAFVAPRQTKLRMQYEIAQLSRSVDHLEGERRRLLLEREALTSPAALAAQLDTLGLTLVGPDRVGHLTPTGDLVLPEPTPNPGRAGAARRSR
jgi:hypothetical protein